MTCPARSRRSVWTNVPRPRGHGLKPGIQTDHILVAIFPNVLEALVYSINVTLITATAINVIIRYLYGDTSGFVKRELCNMPYADLSPGVNMRGGDNLRFGNRVWGPGDQSPNH